MKLTPQQALEEAKKRYPKGTIYKCATGNYFIFSVESVEDFSIYRHKIHAEEGKGVLYDLQTGQWAEIISTPKSLEDRLVDEYRFKVKAFGPNGKKFELENLTIYIRSNDDSTLNHCDVFIGTTIVCSNPNNLEDFIKAYLRLF
jgi:hypothetical protein